MTFHLLFSYSLIALINAALCRAHSQHAWHVALEEKGCRRSARAAYLILGKLCVMHVLVPMFLDTALRSRRKGLWDKVISS